MAVQQRVLVTCPGCGLTRAASAFRDGGFDPNVRAAQCVATPGVKGLRTEVYDADQATVRLTTERLLAVFRSAVRRLEAALD